MGSLEPLPRLPGRAKCIQLRKRMGLTIKDAAKLAGVSENSYGYWERGQRDPSPEHLRKWHSLLSGWQRQIDEVE